MNLAKETQDTMTKFDSKTCEALAQEIVAALQPLAERHGLTVRSAGGTFGLSEWTKKLRFEINDEETRKRAFEELARRYTHEGIRVEWYGAQFSARGRVYRIVGINPTRPKYRIKAEDTGTGERRFFGLQGLAGAIQRLKQ